MSTVRRSRRLGRRAHISRSLRRRSAYAATLLLIELLDELVFGLHAVAWPLIRTDLALDYGQVGLLIGIPIAAGNVVEPLLGIAGDVGNRRAIVRAGGIAFACAALLIATSGGFVSLLAALVLLNPASGAFVSLSQATLVDLDPRREEQAMARWALAGSLGQVLGAGLGGLASRGAPGWRGAHLLIALLTALLVAAAWRWPFAAAHGHAWSLGPLAALGGGMREALRALERRAVVRWLVLLQASDLMVDVLHGFLALYLVDVAGATPGRAAIAVAVWTGAGVVGDLLVLPLLERVSGLRYVRITAWITTVVYALLLLVPGSPGAQLALIALLGVLHAGWYAVLQARLYVALPGRSATVTTVGNVFGLVGALIPLGLGALAERFGLGAAMWALIAGPLALVIGVGSGRTPDGRGG